MADRLHNPPHPCSIPSAAMLVRQMALDLALAHRHKALGSTCRSQAETRAELLVAQTTNPKGILAPCSAFPVLRLSPKQPQAASRACLAAPRRSTLEVGPCSSSRALLDSLSASSLNPMAQLTILRSTGRASNLLVCLVHQILLRLKLHSVDFRRLLHNKTTTLSD